MEGTRNLSKETLKDQQQGQRRKHIMRRYQSMLLGAFLVCWASCGYADEGSTIETVTQAASLPTKVLGSIAAIGDSITQAFNAAHSEFESCEYRDTPAYNFATNKTRNTTISIAERAIAFKGSGIATWNFGSDGARMSSGDDQALEAKTWILNQATPRLVTVFLGHNDICSGEKDKILPSCSSLNRDPNNYCRTKTSAYEQQMRQMMDVLVTIPDSQIAIIHPIRVSQLCNFKEEKVIDEWWLTRRCGDLWEMSGLLPESFEQDGVCPSLTSCSPDRVADAYTTWVSYRDISNKVVEEYNLYTAGETIPSNLEFGTGNVVRASSVSLETTDVVGNSKFMYKDVSGNVQLSVCDCFHPSKYGQNTLASSLWDGVACSATTPCCNDNVVGDSDYNKGLCVNTTTIGWMGGPWAGLEADKTLTVATAGSGAGVVMSTPGGIDCGIDCTETYSHGTVVTLTASADPGFAFRGWSGGGCSGTDPECIVTMIGNTTVTVTFSLPLSLLVNEGTIGTQITITGSDFGTKKGKVLIGGVATRIAKKAWTPTSITGVIKKPLPPGIAYDVVLQLKEPKGVDPITLPGAFTMMAPEIGTVDPNTGAEGTEVEISGNFFSTKKGKVYLGEKKCKISSWGMDSITFVVPKGLDSGSTYPLKVINKVGIAEAPSVFTIN